MGNNYLAMVETADEKYTKLVEYIQRLKNGSEVDYDKIFGLMKSIHKDEMTLIVSLYEAEEYINRKKEELKIPSFMNR